MQAIACLVLSRDCKQLASHSNLQRGLLGRFHSDMALLACYRIPLSEVSVAAIAYRL